MSCAATAAAGARARVPAARRRRARRPRPPPLLLLRGGGAPAAADAARAPRGARCATHPARALAKEGEAAPEVDAGARAERVLRFAEEKLRLAEEGMRALAEREAEQRRKADEAEAQASALEGQLEEAEAQKAKAEGEAQEAQAGKVAAEERAAAAEKTAKHASETASAAEEVTALVTDLQEELERAAKAAEDAAATSDESEKRAAEVTQNAAELKAKLAEAEARAVAAETALEEAELSAEQASDVAAQATATAEQAMALVAAQKVAEEEERADREAEAKRKSADTAAMAGFNFDEANDEPAYACDWEDSVTYNARMAFWSRALLRMDELRAAGHVSTEAADMLRMLCWRRNKALRALLERAEEEAPSDTDHLAGLLAPITQRKERPGMHVVHVTAELAPVAKVGGLADVVTGLGRALQAQGHCVEVVLPKYDILDESQLNGLRQIEGLEVQVPFDNRKVPTNVWSASVGGLPVLLMDPQTDHFHRGSAYGSHDDIARFQLFCAAAMEMLATTERRPDLIHLHEWTGASAAPLFREKYARGSLGSTALVFTAHSLEHQGCDGAHVLDRLGLDRGRLHTDEKMRDPHNGGRVNLMKGAIAACDQMTTVSPTYASEGCTREDGFGLDGALSSSRRSNKLTGILNGIDYDAWDPSSDPHLRARYAVDEEADGETVLRALEGKGVNKAALQQECGLKLDGNVPLVACVGRLAAQKGVQLIRHAIYRTVERGGQFVLLGLPCDGGIRGEFENIAREFEGRESVSITLDFNEKLAHEVYAGADMLVMPSNYEPCGLAQMIAMRYGTAPVVRKTGGLRDSVDDVDDEEGGNGFSFRDANEDGLNWALNRAINYYYDQREWWNQALVPTCMATDWSWATSAQHYEIVYRAAVQAARERGEDWGLQ